MHRIDLTPNSSLSLPAAAVFLGSVAAGPVFIALIFAAQGYWPMLPFAGLELLFLGWALWVSMRRGRHRDCVLLDDEHVIVEKHRRQRRERVEFPRGWARVALEQPASRNHPTRLLIRAHGRHCEIGEFLTDAERDSLSRRLRELLPAAGQGRTAQAL